MSPTPHSRKLEQTAHGLAAALLLLSALRYALLPIGGYDHWWHLRTGQEIWKTRSLLESEPFSYVAQGRPWLYKEPGSELLLYATTEWLGAAGVVLLKGAAFLSLLGALAAAALRYRRVPFWLVSVVGALGIEACSFRVTEGPQTFAFATTAFVLLVLERHRVGRGSLVWVLPLITLTAYLHRGAWLLPPVVTAYALSRFGLGLPTLRGLWRTAQSERATLFVAGLAWLAPLLTPLTTHGLTTTVGVLGTSWHDVGITEWQPLSASVLWAASPWTYALLALLAVALLARGRKQDPWDLALCLLGLALGLRSVRFVPYVFIFCALPTLSGLALLVSRRRRELTRFALGPLLGFVSAAGGAALAVASPLPLPHLGVQHHRLPEAALDFVRSHGLTGRVFNEFQYGGYLIYHLWPQTSVYTDGRSDWVYTAEEIARSGRMPGEPATLEAERRRYGFDWLFLDNRPDDRSRLHLDRDPAWSLVFASEPALVYVRTDGEHAALARTGYRYLAAHDLAGSIAAAVRSGPAGARGAVAEAERMVREDPESYPATLALGIAYESVGDPRAAEAFRRAQWLAERPL